MPARKAAPQKQREKYPRVEISMTAEEKSLIEFCAQEWQVSNARVAGEFMSAGIRAHRVAAQADKAGADKNVAALRTVFEKEAMVDVLTALNKVAGQFFGKLRDAAPWEAQRFALASRDMWAGWAEQATEQGIER
jgi:hypothetical protein